MATKKTIKKKTTAKARTSGTPLELATAEILELKNDVVEAYWRLGRKLLDIQTQQLWKLPTDAEGRPLYKNPDAFSHAELKMTQQRVYAAIDCAKEYETPEEVRELGAHWRAALILSAAPKVTVPRAAREVVMMTKKTK